MGILMSILYFVVMLTIVFGLYVLGKEYVFNKVRINKYIPLAVAIVLLIVQMFGVIKISWIGIILTPIDIKKRRICYLCDVIVDGPYIEEERDIALKWRGSKNQRVINVKKTFSENKVSLWCS